MFASYRRLFAAPGALAFTLTGLFARLSFAMTGVSTVVLIATRRDSYALAGAVSAAGVVAVAVALPISGRLVDRYGQGRISAWSVLLAVWPTAGLLLCAHFGAPAWTLFLCCTASAVVPNLGGMARARWAHLYRDDPAARHVANSLEQALDELCFMGGPVLAMLLCTSLFPEAGLLAGVLLGSAGLLLFAAQRRTEPPVQPPAETAGRGALRDGGLRVLVLVFAATGVVFGSMEVTTIAYADALGRQPLAGGLLALVAAGSCASGLVLGLYRGRAGATRRPGPVRSILSDQRAALGARLGVRPERPRTGSYLAVPAVRPGGMPSVARPARSAGQGLVLGVTAMTVLLLLPLAAGLSGAGLAVLGLTLFVAGSGTAPTMVAGMTMVQELLPARQLNEGMGVAVAGILVGISTGAALGGVVAQQAAPGTGFLVPAGAAGLALLTALAGRRRLRARPAPGLSALAA